MIRDEQNNNLIYVYNDDNEQHVHLIGVAPITQYTHVRNKIVTLKGAHLMW